MDRNCNCNCGRNRRGLRQLTHTARRRAASVPHAAPVRSPPSCAFPFHATSPPSCSPRPPPPTLTLSPRAPTYRHLVDGTASSGDEDTADVKMTISAKPFGPASSSSKGMRSVGSSLLRPELQSTSTSGRTGQYLVGALVDPPQILKLNVEVLPRLAGGCDVATQPACGG